MATEAAPAGGYRWVILTVCWLAFLAASSTRTLWNLVLPHFAGSMALPMSELAGFTTALTVGGVMGTVSGGISDWLGPRRTLGVATLGLGASAALFGLVQSAAVGVPVLGMVGFWAGAGFAATVTLLVAWFGPGSRGRRGLALGILLTAVPTGSVVTTAVGSVLLDEFSWHMAYLGFGLAMVVIGVLALVVLRDRVPTDDPGAVQGAVRGDDLIVLSGAGFGLSWAAGGFATWLVVMMVDGTGVGASSVGLVMFVMGVAAVIGPLISGALWDRLRQPRWIVVGGLGVFAVAMLALAAMPGGQVAGFLGVAPFLGLGAPVALPLLTVMVAEAVPSRRVGLATGLVAGFWHLAAPVGVLAAAWTFGTTQSFAAVLGVLALGPLVGAVLMMAVGGRVRAVGEG